MKLSKIKKNPANPRLIRDEKFARLKKSLKEFPQMMALRPIVVDADGVILGGNMRFEALKANGLKEVPDEWVKRADDLTPEQKQEFIIKDNSGFGEWDWDLLANEWSDLPLSDWGVDIPEVTAANEEDATSGEGAGDQFMVLIECESEQEQAEMLERFNAEGLKCRALLS